jgi:hypothetical protein
VATPGIAVPASPSPKWQSLQALALEIYARTLPIASDTSRRSQCMTVAPSYILAPERVTRFSYVSYAMVDP